MRRACSAGAAALGRGLVLLGLDLLADPLERPPDQPRYVHLRDPDLLRDLRLRQSLEEAQVEDQPLALVQRPEPGREHRAILGHLVLRLFLPERLQRVELALLVLAAPGRKRNRAVRPPTLERLDYGLLLDARRLGQLGNRGRAAELDRLLLDQLRKLDVELLEPARDAHRPALVAEVALDLADDVRRRVRGQLDAAVDVEAVDRLDQPDRPDLDEVVELFAPVRVAPGERPDERHVLLDQLVAGCEIAVRVIAPQKGSVVDVGHTCVLAAALVSFSQSPPSSVSSSARSTSVSRMRRRPTCSPPSAASSPRTPSPIGPTSASIWPSSTRSLTCTVSARTRSSAVSSAS